jgi:hypothetical protein
MYTKSGSNLIVIAVLDSGEEKREEGNVHNIWF